MLGVLARMACSPMNSWRIPVAGLDLRYLGRPDSPGPFFHPVIFRPRLQRDFFTGIGSVCDSVFLGSGILRSEPQRIRLQVCPAANQNEDIARKAGGHLSTNHIACFGQRGQRRRGRAGVGVFAVGSNKNVGFSDCRLSR